MSDMIRARDWGQTPLGAIGGWPPNLGAALETCLRSSLPSLIRWGPSSVVLYNDACIPLVGKGHPALLGASAQPTNWPPFGSLVEAASLETEMSVDGWLPDRSMTVGRSGRVDEVSIAPHVTSLPGDTAEACGTLTVCFDVSRRMRSERRLETCRRVASGTSLGWRDDRIASVAAELLVDDGADVSFAVIYLGDSASGGRLVRRGVAGDVPHRPALPSEILLRQDPAAMPWGVGEVLIRGRPVELTELGEPTARSSAAGAIPEPRVAVMPLMGALPGKLRGVLVVGASERVPFDDRYRSFLALAATQLATTLAAAGTARQANGQASLLAALRHPEDVRSTRGEDPDADLTALLAMSEWGEPPQLSDGARARVDQVRRIGRSLLCLFDGLLDRSRIHPERMASVCSRLERIVASEGLSTPDRHADQLAGVRVLLVDRVSAKKVLAALRRRGAVVTAAASEAEARDALAASAFDVIVCRMSFREIDGFELLRSRRECESARRERIVPAVAIDVIDDAERQRAYRSGYQAHVAPDASHQTLARIIRDLVGRRRAPSATDL
jgi:CheY-like chemotaxis protein